MMAGSAPAQIVQLQQQPQQWVLGADRGAVNPEQFDAKESTEGVIAPESTDAMDVLAKAQRLERLKSWGKSAEYYQGILTDPKFARKVVPSKEDASRHIYQYSSVEELVMQRLSRWPQEGLDIYRGLYEAPAAALLESAKADDQFTLQQVFSHYFVTDSGRTAGMRLIDRYLDDGEFRAAAATGDRLLKWHPNILAERGAVLYRTAIAYHLAGDDAEAQQRLSDLKKHDPQAKGIVRGQDVVLADSLVNELKQPAPVASGSTGDSYGTFGGDATRNRIISVAGTPGAHLYSAALSKWAHMSGPQSQLFEARYKEDVKSGMTLGVMPVVDRGELFFQDGQRLYGLNLESGVPLAGWQQSHGSEHDGAYTLANVTGSPRTHQLTVTVTDHSVLAVMGQQDFNLLRMGIPQPGEMRLVCLDRQTGKERWVIAPSQFKQAALKNLQFGGSPLVVGENVLVMAGESKQQGFEDCNVLCFDINTGTLHWSSHVASATTVSTAFGFNPNAAVESNDSHLAYANGRVFVQTNHGAVAALDAYNGTIAWLDIYPRGQSNFNPQMNPMFFQGGQFPEVQTKPWTFNPLMVSQGMVFTLPPEGKHLLIYDAASGAEVKRIDLKELSSRLKEGAPEPDTFETLIGVVDNKLIVSGSQTVVSVDWKTYDSDHFLDTMVLWSENVFSGIRGKPFLTSNSVYVPDTDRLYRLNLKSGLIEEGYPSHPRTWDDGEGPGNVLVTSDHMVIAGSDDVAVYTDLEAAKKKLDREVADAPNDPQPRLRYAEVMYAASDYDTALGKLDEAITRLGGADAMQPGTARDRVFNDALAFAQKLRSDDKPESRARVEKLFDRASQAALSPGQKVQYLMARARFDEIRKDPPAALMMYQQVLASAATRVVPLPDETSSEPASADVVARKQIAELIKHDPPIYLPFEKEAAAALQTAEGSKDAGKLLEVAQEYPNSSVAPKAMLDAADAYEAAGDMHASRHVLSDIYFDHVADASNRPAEWPQILEAMARTDPPSAAHMLAQGVADLHDPKLTKPLKLADGSEVPADTAFSAALEKVRKVAYQEQARALPDFGLPVPHPVAHQPYPKPFKAESPVIANVDALVQPLRDFSRPDRIVTWSTAPVLTIYPAGTIKPLASVNPVPEQPSGCAWTEKNLLVWGPKQLALFKGDEAQFGWKVDVSTLAPLEVIATEHAPDSELPVANNIIRPQNRAMMIRRGGQAFIRNGLVVNAGFGIAGAAPKAVPAGPEEIDQVLPVGQRVLLSTTNGRVMAIETGSGQIAWQTRLTDRPIDRLLGNEDFTVIKSEDDASIRLAVLDTFTGHVRGSRTFQRATNSFPQNLALSPDGTLVYTLPDRICLKDLYKPWGEKEIEKTAAPGQASFLGLTQPDQLVISEGRILAVTDSGNTGRQGEKFVRLYSLETGEPIMLHFADGQQVEQALSIGSKSPESAIRVVGPRAYLIAPDAAICYNLQNLDDHYQMFDETSEGIGQQIYFIGQGHLIMLNSAAAAAANPPPMAQPVPGIGGLAQPPAGNPPPKPALSPDYILYAYSRAIIVKGHESGTLDYNPTIKDPGGITADWQPMNGGLVYLSGDHKLHMLLGAKQ